MNLRTFIATLTACTVTFTGMANAQLFSSSKDEHIFVVISNVTGHNEVAAKIYGPTIDYVLGRELENYDRSSNRGKTISVILTSTPNRMIFSGSLRDLYGESSRVYEDAAIVRKCNDLVRVYSQIQRQIELRRIDGDVRRVRIIHIGPMIHAPIGCSPNSPIEIPQELPEDMPLGKILSDVKSGGFEGYLVRDEQEASLMAYLGKFGLTEKKKMNIGIFRPEATMTKIGFREEVEGENNK